MNWQKRLPLAGAVLVLAGVGLLALNHKAIHPPIHTLDTAGWAVLGLGVISVLLGFAPPQLITMFAIPELRRKILITLAFLAVYRIGYYVPLPMIDQAALGEKMANAAGGTVGKLLGFVSLFSGGNLSSACVFALGIMPYISASIIMQLLSSGVVPSLERLRKEGQSGQKKINEYTRYLTVPICIVQSFMMVNWLTGAEPDGMGLLIKNYTDGLWPYYFKISAVLILTCGTLFLMWLGEQIDEYGIGNGISLIIMAGIVARIPDATGNLLYDSTTGKLKESVFTLGSSTGDTSLEKLIILALLFVAVVIGVIAITKAQRRVPTRSDKQVRGRRVFGGTRNYLPMKVNAAGVMPVIFASTLLILPGFLFNLIYHWAPEATWAGSLSSIFMGSGRGWLYNVCYVALIFVFCYFWVAITFNPKEVADNLKDHGSFIPGYRPGKSTADYLERVLTRVTYVGSAFLAVVAVIPTVISTELNVDYRVASFYGGTGLLIVISVALDLVQKINSHLVMRNYPGLTED